ncbi:MAG: MlaD family protein [Mycobacterium sp.]
MQAGKRTRAIVHGATAAVVAVSVSACGIGLEALPLAGPGAGSGGTYTLTAVFANALNLPAKAKIKLNGADIGEVQSITASNYTAHAVLKIRDDVILPRGTTAELRSATPLGDLFIAVHRNSDPQADQTPLRDGATIGLDSTSGGATIEDALSSAALLVNGGVIRNVTNLINGAGAAVGGQGANLKGLLNHSNTLIARLNGRSTQIKAALDNTAELARTLSARQNSLNQTLEALVPATDVLNQDTSQIIALTNTAARITSQLSRFPSLQGTDTRSLIADINRLSETFNSITTDPSVSLTDINRLIPIAMKITNSPAIHGIAEVTQLALGSLPDKNYPGDPMFHGPDGTDWHAMVGSLRYEWNLMLDKIYGPNR